MKKILLATASPFKRQLFERLQLPYECVNPRVDETPLPEENALALSQRLAHLKAQAVAPAYQDYLIIGCDQAPETSCGTILHKAGTKNKAKEELLKLSGKTVTFYTSVTLLNGSEENTSPHCHTDTTVVSYRHLNPEQVDRYLEKESAWHCAGSIQSEALGISLLSEVKTSDPSALIGLPLIGLCNLLGKFGIVMP